MGVISSEEKTRQLKKVSLHNKRNPTNAIMQKLKKTQKELTNTYQKKQLEDIQGQIDKIRYSEDR